MAIKRYKALTHSLRNMTTNAYSEITTNKPEKSLLTTKKRTGGRNAYGRITVRHIGGGNLIKLRKVDFRRNGFFLCCFSCDRYFILIYSKSDTIPCYFFINAIGYICFVSH